MLRGPGIVTPLPLMAQRLLPDISFDLLDQRVKLPSGTHRNHWLATHTDDFFKLMSVIYNALIGHCCTSEKCPKMNYGTQIQYVWKGEAVVNDKIEQLTTPTSLSAPDYVASLFRFISNKIDEKFPTDQDAPYPNDFDIIVSDIFKKIFRVYVHIYTSHYSEISRGEFELSLNTAFHHFIRFAWEFNLIPTVEFKFTKEMLKAIFGQEHEKVAPFFNEPAPQESRPALLSPGQ